MNLLLVAVAGMLAIAVTAQLGPRIGVASPLILLALSITISFLPWVDAIELAPAIVLEVILPPLLFGAAASMPVMDFRRDLTAVSGLAIGLVALSALVLGFTIHTLIPAITLPWAVELGAVLSPTDAVAISIARGGGVSHRIITVLEGEGLFNDATALVLLSAATSSALRTKEHALAPLNLGINFLIALVIAILVGLLVGELGVRVRAKITEPAADTVFSFTMPFLASIPAEHLGGSGLVAAVVAGLIVSYRRVGLIPAQNRRFAQQNWRTLEFVLEGLVFLTMGLQAFGIVTDVYGGNMGLGRAALVAIIAGLLTVLVRALFVATFLAFLAYSRKHYRWRLERIDEHIRYHEERIAHACDRADELMEASDLTQEQLDAAIAKWHSRVEVGKRRLARKGNDLKYWLREPLGPREGSVIVWAGMRGAVTLAAAQTLPLTAPARSFMLLVALLVAAGSLVIQGLSLPLLIRLVKPQLAEESHDEEERERLFALLRSRVKDSALSHSIAENRPVSGASAPLTGVPLSGRAWPAFTEERTRALALESIHQQREALIEARDDGVFSSAVLERCLERIDYEEILLAQRH